jgi:phosphoglycerate kinase
LGKEQAMKVRYVDEISVSGKKVFVRVDFNVPLTERGEVAEDHRIRAVLPTLRHILEQGGRSVVASHLGRPKGKPVASMSLAPAARVLEKLLGRPVGLAPDCIGPEVERMAEKLGAGEVLMLENLRFHPEEEKNDPTFARALAGTADVYVNDAFAASHRAHASVDGITRYVSICAAGFLMKQELDYFHRIMEAPERPLVAVLGGVKVSTKLPILKQFASRVDRMIIGGAMANTFLKGMGLDLGASLVEEDLLKEAMEVLDAARGRGVRVYLPADFVIAERLEAGVPTRVVSRNQVPAGWIAFDVGPETRRQFAEALEGAGTIVWNGPLGAFEVPGFEGGTMAMAESVAKSSAVSVVGGGDTDRAVHMAGKAEAFSYISTGGGAFLELLEGRTLPGVKALETCGG